MQRVFIFAEQVKKIIATGKRDIEIPEGARISAAAAELIKDHKFSIKIVAAQSVTATAVPQAEDQPVPRQPTSSQDTQSRTSAKTAAVDKPAVSGNDISDEELEALVNRVIARFKQLKGITPAPSRQKQGAVDESQQPPDDDDDMIICRCEEITKGEIKSAIRNGMQTVNGIKRITRAGMGLCQGQTCQRLVIQIIAEELRQSVADIEPTTARGPVRPLNLAVFANS
ncbi:MAG: (2Fe-2S)-binding protein [Desulfobacterales bacterium]|jgi:bacterioferritin-associated ferredoxin|nr:(2Fe-2S)-binding protein [Desulfobacterales bacterium]MDH3825971.1 (2Fe-2S)-binding protein [Desulfobacterales bacterium]MDH3876488.1 (2Fe-2S)-binding protein [Desulfobacterales bacterium]MDH4010171.1 (2Fe-2S)-binding protein [Desulfobacterales bacterium]